MYTTDSYEYIETKNSGFDYPSENMDYESASNEVNSWLDDLGWV